MTPPEQLARRFHELYETMAPEFGYKTRAETAVPWEDLPQNNRQLMTVVATKILDEIWPIGASPLSVLQEAHSLIRGERAQTYGPPTESFNRIARLWAAYLGIEELTGRQVAHMMILMKVSRDVNSPKRDNLVDIGGYAGCIELMDESL